jgi:molecular chaperone Hsp33
MPDASVGFKQQSRVYSFLAEADHMLWHFLDGRRLIADLATRTRLQGLAFGQFRDAVLTFQLLQTFLKTGEGLGLYIDGEQPVFCLKIEMNSYGHMRSMVWPQEVPEFPKAIHGICRVLKTIPSQSEPYTSVIQLNGESMREIVNEVLRASSQMDSFIAVSDLMDHSVLLHRLPKKPRDQSGVAANSELETGPLSDARQYFFRRQLDIRQLLDHEWDHEGTMIAAMSRLNLLYLGSTPVEFLCTCSQQRMIANLQRVARMSPQDLEPEMSDQGFVSLVCDYCLTEYKISSGDLVAESEIL